MDFTCSICLGLLSSPVRLNCCKGKITICKKCLPSSSKCPFCRRTLDYKLDLELAFSIFSKILSCHDCKEEVYLSKIFQHLDHKHANKFAKCAKCTGNLYQLNEKHQCVAGLTNCGETISAAGLPQHYLNCSKCLSVKSFQQSEEEFTLKFPCVKKYLQPVYDPTDLKIEAYFQITEKSIPTKILNNSYLVFLYEPHLVICLNVHEKFELIGKANNQGNYVVFNREDLAFARSLSLDVRSCSVNYMSEWRRDRVDNLRIGKLESGNGKMTILPEERETSIRSLGASASSASSAASASSAQATLTSPENPQSSFVDIPDHIRSNGELLSFVQEQLYNALASNGFISEEEVGATRPLNSDGGITIDQFNSDMERAIRESLRTAPPQAAASNISSRGILGGNTGINPRTDPLGFLNSSLSGTTGTNSIGIVSNVANSSLANSSVAVPGVANPIASILPIPPPVNSSISAPIASIFAIPPPVIPNATLSPLSSFYSAPAIPQLPNSVTHTSSRKPFRTSNTQCSHYVSGQNAGFCEKRATNGIYCARCSKYKNHALPSGITLAVHPIPQL